MRKIRRQEMTREHAAKDGCRRRGDCAAHRPDRHGPRSRAGLGVGLTDQGHRRWQHHCRRRALDEAGGDEQAEIRGEAARRRCGDEPDHADDERSARPAAIAGRASREQQRGEHERVAVDHPLQPGDPPPRPDRIDGNATLTTTASKVTMKNPKTAANNAARATAGRQRTSRRRRPLRALLGA